ncbi:MAG: short-chain fatty acid transporter [Phycisphaerae bacterium]
MISQLGLICSRVFCATCPDPFVIAILLTVLSAVLALTLGDVTATRLLERWGDGSDGIWKLLSFSMQMCFILVTGHALASTRLVRNLIESLASTPRTASQAAGLVGALTCLTSIINWGLGLIFGALMAREVGRAMHRKGVPVHYPLLAAAGFVGLMVWHGGLSGSAPLTSTTIAAASKVLPKESLALLGNGIPLTETIFSPMNVFVTGGLVLLTPLMLMALMPRRADQMRTIEHYTTDLHPLRRHGEPDEPTASTLQPRGGTVPEWLDNSAIVAWLLAVPLLAAFARTIWNTGRLALGATPIEPAAIDVVLSGLKSFGLNEINTVMLALGLILHGSPRAYMAAIDDGARGCGGIIIQFPLYAGILAIMTASGLIKDMATMFGSTGSATVVPLLSFAAACVINFFVPSGGGQWAVQGPIALEAGNQVGAPLGKMVMSVAYGDQVTNMLQPFWALPLISITGVPARELIGYTAVVMLLGAAWSALGLLLF